MAAAQVPLSAAPLPPPGAFATRPEGDALVEEYQRLLDAHEQLLRICAASAAAPRSARVRAPPLGVLQLAPHAAGDDDDRLAAAVEDVACPMPFECDVEYRQVTGLTADVCSRFCRSGASVPASAAGEAAEVREAVLQSVAELDRLGVSAVTADSSLLLPFAATVREATARPVLLSALALLPSLMCSYNIRELIVVLTADESRLRAMRDLIKEECLVDLNDERVVVVGLEDLLPLHREPSSSQAGAALAQRAADVLASHPDARAILLEEAGLTRHSGAIRAATGVPVFDALSVCDFLVAGRLDTDRFGCGNPHLL
eukprot:TRINITY_DN76157_c0_g1_i1.p1 TRINITY_DN76157_c0_g1~~TRINITY_DN76157_c0_g1_i1.p1  ORF type:complete len:333 (+),score=87.33 TRINITY_DN76157_c0_g1_i1:55-999(+)